MVKMLYYHIYIKLLFVSFNFQFDIVMLNKLKCLEFIKKTGYLVKYS